MPRLAAFDSDALTRILTQQHAIISRDQALACGLTPKAVRHRIRSGGPWQVVVPGIYQAQRGMLTDKQRAVAAWMHAGRPIAITGPAALAWHQIPATRTDLVDVLVPHGCRRADAEFIRLHRTTVVPRIAYEDGRVSYADPARAIADTVRQLPDLREVRAVVAAGVQREKVYIWQLASELDTGPVRQSAQLRQALAEVAAGARSTAEADLMTLIRQAKLPEPLYNPKLYVGEEFLASPDAWWPDSGVAVEVDSKAWHLLPADWDQSLERHARMTAQGILVLHFSPLRLRAERRAVRDDIRAALANSRGPLPHITTTPASW